MLTDAFRWRRAFATDHGPPTAPRRRLVLLLAGAAGSLDAVGYLMLGLFTANMTGNTILLGLSVGREAWPDALRNVVALAAFVAGAAIGAVVVRSARRLFHGLGLEAALIVAALAVWGGFGGPRGHVAQPAASWLIALLAAAMGLQSATVRRVGEHRIATTYVTGTLTTLATDAVGDLLDRWSGPVSRAPSVAAEESQVTARASSIALMLGIWGTYLLGALVAGFLERRWSMWAIVPAILALLGVMAANFLHRHERRVDRAVDPGGTGRPG